MSKFTNKQYLTTTQQQDKMKQLKSRAQEAEREVKWLQDIIERSVETNGTAVDPILHNDCDNHGREIGSNKAAVPERSIQQPFLGAPAESSKS